MNRVRAIAERWLTQGVPAVVVEVLRVEGSAPRHAGTRMLVAADRAEGTIGGGHLEFVAITTARRVLAGAAPPPDTRYALGPSLGQCCGGVVWLRLARLDARVLAAWPATPPTGAQGDTSVPPLFWRPGPFGTVPSCSASYRHQ